MQKTLPPWAFPALSLIGVVLVGSMLLSWVDVGHVRASGFQLALHESRWLILVPVAGVALVAAAAARSRHTRLAAIFAGLVVAGDVLLDLANSIIHSGADTWLILVGAATMLVGARHGGWRAIGGIAVLVGFCAPWAQLSLWQVLTHEHIATLKIDALWLIPLAGVVGIVAAFTQAGAKLSAAAGITVYGALLFVIGALASMVFGIGAWVALGASAMALVIGVLASSSMRALAARR